VQHERNRGLAEAINTGLAHAAEQAEARDIILTMDADNSHTPGLIASMVRKIHEGHDVVIASRYQPGARVVGLTLHRRLLSRVASLLFQAVLPIPNVRDYTCGFRAYRASLIQRVRQDDPNFISEQGFTVMVDILLKLRTQQPEVLMAEVPLLLRYDLKKGASKMNVGRTSRQTLALIVRRRLGGTG
jgi:dolichol-phosphate mannosyltransferase